MEDNKNNTSAIARARGIFALLAVLMVIVGQTILYTSPTQQNTGIPTYMWLSLAGVVLFVLSLSLPVPLFLQKIFANLPFGSQIGWLIAAIALSALATISLAWFEKMTNLSYLPVITLWLGSVACYVAAFTQYDINSFGLKDWLRDHRKELAAVAIVTLLAAFLRLYRLGTIPKVINGDEGWLGLMAQETIHDPLINPFAIWNNFSAFYLQAVNFVFTLFGPNIFSVRFLTAIAGTLSVPATYLFARQVAGKRIALIAAILLAVSHFEINYSRTSGSDYIFSALFIPLILYFVLSAFEKTSRWRIALAGTLLAIYFCTYQMAQVLVGIFVVVSLVILFFGSWRQSFGQMLMIFWGGFVIPVFPEAVYIGQHPQDFFARLNQAELFKVVG